MCFSFFYSSFILLLAVPSNVFCEDESKQKKLTEEKQTAEQTNTTLTKQQTPPRYTKRPSQTGYQSVCLVFDRLLN